MRRPSPYLLAGLVPGALAAAQTLAGCGARTGLEVPSHSDAAPGDAGARQPTAIPPVPMQARADKIDLLFVIDDSGSMSDKQTILSRALPDLVARLINPLCVDPGTLRPVANQPKRALDGCPGGSLREFNSVQDVHVGTVSTSLGGVGASSCGVGFGSTGANDHGHLRPPATGPGATTGFLSWDPAGTGTPPGESNADTFLAGLRSLVTLGQGGCPYEMPLEAMYRFLIDPAPYARVELATCPDGSTCAVPGGIDQVLLDQRRRFLRYDSLVAVVVLTDENDCSLVAGGGSFHVFDAVGSVPRATSACARDPNDPCCRSCDAPALPGCQASDAECAKGPYASSEDSGFLRCFDQKRRLGVDYLYPVERYVQGLTARTITGNDGNPVDNPLFVDPTGQHAPRDPSLVFLAGIIGVPWQDIAVDPADTAELELKNAAALERDGTWPLVIGDPSKNVPPKDPLMIESIAERTGVQPILGVPLAPSSSTNPLANPINGHETALGSAPMDLQYACIFDLPAPQNGSIDCQMGVERAVCQAPDGSYGVTQFRAKAYPGIRELQVLKGVGAHAITGSICARNVRDEARADFGYRPVLRSILDRLRIGLN